MSIFKRLFGGGGAETEPSKAPSEAYNDFQIYPEPMKDAGGWRIAARIEKDGKTHQLIRADTLQDFDAAVTASIQKARQVIDEQGERIFQ